MTHACKRVDAQSGAALFPGRTTGHAYRIHALLACRTNRAARATVRTIGAGAGALATAFGLTGAAADHASPGNTTLPNSTTSTARTAVRGITTGIDALPGAQKLRPEAHASVNQELYAFAVDALASGGAVGAAHAGIVCARAPEREENTTEGSAAQEKTPEEDPPSRQIDAFVRPHQGEPPTRFLGNVEFRGRPWSCYTSGAMSLEASGRQAECPNCGGPIEWKLGASAAQVCKWCRFSVVRTDRDLQAIGKVADLVPTAPEIAVGDFGTIGPVQFTVGGRLQLDHGKGPWDEWYVGLSDGRWGWLAKAQGHWYLTFPVEAHNLPAWDQMTPGNTGNLPGTGETPWTVTERGRSRLLSAEGELPMPTRAGEEGAYVDLVGPGGAFATIDYGDGSEPPRFYAGQQHERSAIAWAQGGTGPRPDERVDVGSLKCPNCGGPCPILVPDQTERAACPSCNAVLDFSAGAFQYLGQLNQPQVKPWIPLGTSGRLGGEDVLCIGFMERCVIDHGVTYAWREYLLHSQAGYRWLLEDSGHWTLLTPVSPADVKVSGQTAQYGGTTHKLFSRAEPSVRFVIGEFYWKVEIGEKTEATDFVAPPSLLSEERTRGEIHWSKGTYLKGAEVWKGFGLAGAPPKPWDVAPAQPNPVSLLVPAVVAVLGTLAVVAMFLLSLDTTPTETLFEGPVTIPTQPEAGLSLPGSRRSFAKDGPSVHVSYSQPFDVPPKCSAVEVAITSDLNHGYLGIAAALIDRTNGRLSEFVIDQDYYHGIGQARITSGRTARARVGNLDAGSYVLRLDPRWARKPGSAGEKEPPSANLRVTSVGEDSDGCCCAFAVGLMFLPIVFALVRRGLFESRRWRNSSVR